MMISHYNWVILSWLIIGTSASDEPGSDIFSSKRFGSYSQNGQSSQTLTEDVENLTSELLLAPSVNICGKKPKVFQEQPMKGDSPYSEATKKIKVIKHESLSQNCSFYTATRGFECVPYYQCDIDGTIISDGAGLIDIRFGGDMDEEEPEILLDATDKMCASSMDFGEWPHMCAVLGVKQLAGNEVNLYECGGSLIAPGVVLTAAHCAEKLKAGSSKVRCGEWDTQTENEPNPHQDRQVVKIVIHPEFNQRSLAEDFALLFTESDFDLNKHVDTVCLPKPGETFDTDRCWVTGWGKDKFGKAGSYQVILKEIDLPMMSHTKCEWNLQTKTRLTSRFRLHSSFVCAGGEAGKDACKGDGGGPLVCPMKQDPNRVGVVAWGIGCGEEGVPGAYGSVPHGLCWIDWALSCNYDGHGDQSSYFGFGRECQSWMSKRLKNKRLPRTIRNSYKACRINWDSAKTGRY
eukprot:maker-scaffold21_size687808-snap-gene-0.11 protein:Tk09827 transcript:maker-scaffold21_size687808-snap-gene-0.11-mRNA-1 annotation:"GI19467"